MEKINQFPSLENQKIILEAITKTPELPGKLGKLNWPLELQGGGKTTSEENMRFEVEFPIGDIFLSYISTIHELGHLRQESLNPKLKNTSKTHQVLYAQEVDAWERGWERFKRANPSLMATLEEKFNTYKKQKKFTYNSFEDLYNWIKKNALIIIKAQKILFDESPKTKEEKIDDIVDELEKMGIREFFSKYKASRVGENVQESEIRQAIKNTIELIKKE